MKRHKYIFKRYRTDRNDLLSAWAEGYDCFITENQKWVVTNGYYQQSKLRQRRK